MAFRLDASLQIGSGHAMRCLTLADALRARGAQARFVCRQLSDSLGARITQRGHELRRIGAGETPEPCDDLPQSALLGTSQAQDARATVEVLQDKRWDLLVVDHYALDRRWESALRDATSRILAIDDTADRDHDCDLLLDQNLYPRMETRYAGRVPARTTCLLGPRYALLRPEFAEWRARTAPRAGAIGRVLVLLGGGDAGDLTGRTLDVLEHALPPGIGVDVIIGAEHRRRDAIVATCARLGYDCHVQTDQVAALMARADLAVGAGGSASWERSCLGLGTLCVTLADNQVEIARALADSGACLYLGPDDADFPQRLEAALTSLLRDPARVRALSERAFGLVDGRGAERVCEAIGGRA